MPSDDARPGVLLRAFPYAIVCFLYLATWPFHHGLNNPNEMVRVYTTKAMVEDETPVIDDVLKEWGPVDDKAIRDGHLYSSKAPLQSLVGVPTYALLAKLGDTKALNKRQITTVLRVTSSAIFGILFSWALIFWIRRRHAALGASYTQATGAGLAIALGTMLYPYSLTYTGHLLAALTAGGAYLAAVSMGQCEVGGTAWTRLAIGMGLLAGAAPFAEYPAALVALPALVGGFIQTPRGHRVRLFALLAVGGFLPFGLGLWAHYDSWGSPFSTGYSFLENRAYIKVHGSGFFGVGAPKLHAFLGALFSPGTGLLFFSPLLAVGLYRLIPAAFVGQAEGRRSPISRSMAVAGLVGVVLELLFIAGHSGWRGGWTVGPRYIIPVAPVLGVWVFEALRTKKLSFLIAPLGAVSIVATGFASALYPHLSDVYTNPLVTFLWPSYRDGYSTYGIGNLLGLEGQAANMVHVVPLVIALVYVGLSDTRVSIALRAVFLVVAVAAFCGGIAMIPEHDPAAAHKENERLWGFWEPRRTEPEKPGLVFSGRKAWRQIRVEAIDDEGKIRRCRFVPTEPDRCSYGDQPWQHFGPDGFDIGGTWTPILFMHPITEKTVRAQIPKHPTATRGVFSYGLSDASFSTGNETPVRGTLSQGRARLAEFSAGEAKGMNEIEFSLTSTAPIQLEIDCAKDGARVFGWNIEQFSQ